MNEQYPEAGTHHSRFGRRSAMAMGGVALLLAGILIGGGIAGPGNGPAFAEANGDAGASAGRVRFTPTTERAMAIECANLGDQDLLKHFTPTDWTKAEPIGAIPVIPADIDRPDRFELFAGTPAIAIQRVEIEASGATGETALALVGCGPSTEEARKELESALDAALAEGRISAEQAQRLRADLATGVMATGPIAVERATEVPDGAKERRVIVLADRRAP